MRVLGCVSMGVDNQVVAVMAAAAASSSRPKPKRRPLEQKEAELIPAIRRVLPNDIADMTARMAYSLTDEIDEGLSRVYELLGGMGIPGDGCFDLVSHVAALARDIHNSGKRNYQIHNYNDFKTPTEEAYYTYTARILQWTCSHCRRGAMNLTIGDSSSPPSLAPTIAARESVCKATLELVRMAWRLYHNRTDGFYASLEETQFEGLETFTGDGTIESEAVRDGLVKFNDMIPTVEANLYQNAEYRRDRFLEAFKKNATRFKNYEGTNRRLTFRSYYTGPYSYPPNIIQPGDAVLNYDDPDGNPVWLQQMYRCDTSKWSYTYQMEYALNAMDVWHCFAQQLRSVFTTTDEERAAFDAGCADKIGLDIWPMEAWDIRLRVFLGDWTIDQRDVTSEYARRHPAASDRKDEQKLGEGDDDPTPAPPMTFAAKLKAAQEAAKKEAADRASAKARPKPGKWSNRVVPAPAPPVEEFEPVGPRQAPPPKAPRRGVAELTATLLDQRFDPRQMHKTDRHRRSEADAKVDEETAPEERKARTTEEIIAALTSRGIAQGTLLGKLPPLPSRRTQIAPAPVEEKERQPRFIEDWTEQRAEVAAKLEAAKAQKAARGMRDLDAALQAFRVETNQAHAQLGAMFELCRLTAIRTLKALFKSKDLMVSFVTGLATLIQQDKLGRAFLYYTQVDINTMHDLFAGADEHTSPLEVMDLSSITRFYEVGFQLATLFLTANKLTRIFPLDRTEAYQGYVDRVTSAILDDENNPPEVVHNHVNRPQWIRFDSRRWKGMDDYSLSAQHRFTQARLKFVETAAVTTRTSPKFINQAIIEATTAAYNRGETFWPFMKALQPELQVKDTPIEAGNAFFNTTPVDEKIEWTKPEMEMMRLAKQAAM